MPEIPLAKANKAQLLAKAAEMNLEVLTSATNAALVEAIKAAGGPDVITIAPKIPLMSPVDDDVEVEDLAKTKTTKEEKADDKAAGYSKVVVTIGEQEGEPDHIQLLCNGKNMLVPRGRPVTIPRKYFQILENSKKTVYKRGTQPGEPALSDPRDIPRIPYVVHSKQ